jgi:hypothetical protein
MRLANYSRYDDAKISRYSIQQECPATPWIDEETRKCFALWAAVVELARWDIREANRLRQPWDYTDDNELRDSAVAFLGTLGDGDVVYDCGKLLGKI